MPHKHRKRRNKTSDLLITTDQVVQAEDAVVRPDRENLVTQMSDQEIAEAVSTIRSRFDTAKDDTDAIAEKMEKWEKQYNGVWQDTTNSDEDDIYLPKTREQVTIISAYITLLISQLDPLVTMLPMVTSIWASKEEYRRAKVAEAMLQFYFKDVWKLRDDVFPRWLKTFLKFSMGVWKVTYHNDSFLPDLKIDVVDRALLYIDPAAHDIRNARWVVEKYYLPRSEVFQRIEEGHWHLRKDFHDFAESGTGVVPDATLKRYLGDNTGNKFSVKEDDLVEVWDYWQAPRQGLQDVYAVMLGGDGGQLVRYGRNPFPYKGLPYRAKSFDPHEYRPDGTGAVEQYTPFQEVVNNFLNMRITDVRKNIIQPVAATGRFVDAQTQQDFKDGRKLVRLSDEVMEASKDPSFDLKKHFVPLPFSTSTGELLVQDLPFILGQGKESMNISDVFRGQNPQPGATLGQVQEQLNRNQGVFRPIYLQVMRGLEELAEICMEYFKDPEFFPTERIISIVGNNRYEDVIKEWHNPGGNMFVRSVTPDEMDVDVTIDAVSGADVLASRTFLLSSIEQIFQSIGQIPELFNELKEDFNFSRMVEQMINVSGQDIEALRLSPEQKKEKQKEKQASEEKAMQQQAVIGKMQAKISTLEEQGKAQAKAEAQIAVDANKALLDRKSSEEEAKQDLHSAIREIVTEVKETLRADLIRMNREAQLERQDANVAVGHGSNVNE